MSFVPLLNLSIFAGWTDKIEGQTFPLEDGTFRMTQYEPYGVCAGIGPWNVTTLCVCG